MKKKLLCTHVWVAKRCGRIRVRSLQYSSNLSVCNFHHFGYLQCRICFTTEIIITFCPTVLVNESRPKKMVTTYNLDFTCRWNQRNSSIKSNIMYRPDLPFTVKSLLIPNAKKETLYKCENMTNADKNISLQKLCVFLLQVISMTHV